MPDKLGGNATLTEEPEGGEWGSETAVFELLGRTPGCNPTSTAGSVLVISPRRKTHLD
jgi:hypothetical protein